MIGFELAGTVGATAFLAGSFLRGSCALRGVVARTPFAEASNMAMSLHGPHEQASPPPLPHDPTVQPSSHRGFVGSSAKASVALRKGGQAMALAEQGNALAGTALRLPSGLLRCCHAVLSVDPDAVHVSAEADCRDYGEAVAAVGLDWPVPDLSVPCNRQLTLAVWIPYRRAPARGRGRVHRHRCVASPQACCAATWLRMEKGRPHRLPSRMCGPARRLPTPRGR